MNRPGPVIRTYRVPTTAIGADVPTYVLLHGIGLSHRFFTPLARALRKTGNVISFDLPGFGAAPRPNTPLLVEDFAALIARELRKRPVGRVVAVGHSMGAQFALDLALKNPDLVSHVVLIGPVVDPAQPSLTAQFVALARDAPLEPPLTQTAVAFDYIRCGIPWFLTAAPSMRDYPTHLRIHGLTKPLLVIRGQHDPIAKTPWASWLSGQSDNGRLVTIAMSRHNVPHSHPAATAEAITRFAPISVGTRQGRPRAE